MKGVDACPLWMGAPPKHVGLSVSLLRASVNDV
jgi:hypothetical protein